MNTIELTLLDRISCLRVKETYRKYEKREELASAENSSWISLALHWWNICAFSIHPVKEISPLGGRIVSIPPGGMMWYERTNCPSRKSRLKYSFSEKFCVQMFTFKGFWQKNEVCCILWTICYSHRASEVKHLGGSGPPVILFLLLYIENFWPIECITPSTNNRRAVFVSSVSSRCDKTIPQVSCSTECFTAYPASCSCLSWRRMHSSLSLLCSRY